MAREKEIARSDNASDKNKQRRAFIDKSMKLGLAAVAGTFGVTRLIESAEGKAIPGESVELMTTDGKLVKVDQRSVEKIPEAEHVNPREGFAHRKFVMVIDLARCKNARKCQSSCNKNHYITGPNAWLKVYKMQNSEEESPYWQPTTCQHCDKPPCVKVCPVDATFKRRDGIVLIDNDRCIGCRFCMAACPYSTRVFNWGEPDQPEEIAALPNDLDYGGVPAEKGTVDKCDFCPHMIDKGKLPHCVTACPNGVFFFGDQYEDTVTNGDETYRLSELLEEKSGYRLMEELGTKPSVYYLPPKDRLQEFEKGLDNYDEFNSVEKEEKS